MYPVAFLFWSTLMVTPVVHAENKTVDKNQRPSEHFRLEHVELQKHLTEVGQWVGELYQADKTSSQKNKLNKITGFFKEHIKPHAEWEEKKLYPAVDKRAGTTEVFTASMRHEHKIVSVWLADLEKEANLKNPDLQKFARKTDQLLGLIKAHFEVEEEVLLPILDKTMTPEQFKNEILSESAH